MAETQIAKHGTPMNIRSKGQRSRSQGSKVTTRQPCSAVT